MSGYARVFSSPSELLTLICPPNCSIGINFNDHRFVATFRVEHERWIDELAKKSRSKRFLKGSWQPALQHVHEWAWKKWDICRDVWPLGDPDDEQTPGQILPEVLEGLAPIIQSSGDPKRY